MFDFIGYALKAPLEFAKKFAKNPIGIVFYGLVSKWYLLVMSLTAVVIYWVLTGLAQAGILQLALDTFNKASLDIKAVAQHCPPRIRDIHDFIDCLMDTPPYQPDETTRNFEEEMQQTIDSISDHPVRENLDILSPYDQAIIKKNQ